MRVCISAIIAMMAISGGLVEGQDESSVKLELLYEKPFADLYSTSEGFPPPEIKQILDRDDIPLEDKDWLLNSFLIEIARREKVIYTYDGRIIELLQDVKSIVASDNYKYFVVYSASTDFDGLSHSEIKQMNEDWRDAFTKFGEWRSRYENAYGNKKEIYKDSMYHWLNIRDSLERLLSNLEKNKVETKITECIETSSGRKVWRNTSMMSPSHLADDGRAIVVPGYYAYDHALFYDANGDEISKAIGFFGPQQCHDMSADGEMFCAITRLKGTDTLPMAVVAFNSKGNELWRTEIQGVRPFTDPCIAVSPNHKYVAAALLGEHWWKEAYTTLLDNNGTTIGVYNCNTYFPAFSQDDEYLILWASQDTTYFIETQTGKVRWKIYLPGHADKTASMPKDGQVIFIYSMITDRHPAYLLDLNGNILWRGTYDMKNAVGFSPNGHFLIASYDPQTIILEIVEEGTYEDK
jgi:outer membrane protein assembly factor BamB